MRLWCDFKFETTMAFVLNAVDPSRPVVNVSVHCRWLANSLDSTQAAACSIIRLQ